MPLGITTRNSIQTLIRDGIDENFRDQLEQFDPQWTKHLRFSTVDRPEVLMTTVVGPNRLFIADDNDPTIYQNMKTGPLIGAVDREYKGGYVVTQKALEDDRYGRANQGARYLADSANYTMEYSSAEPLDQAFNAVGPFRGMDGLSLIHENHTILGDDTRTIANGFTTTPIGFSLAGVSALMELADRMVNHNGDPMPVVLDKAIIPNSQSARQRAYKIFRMMMEPGTANNDENAIRAQLGEVDFWVNNYRSNLASYFMFSDKLNDYHFRERVALSIEDSYGREKELYTRARMRFMIYFYNWRGWYGQNAT